MSFAFENLYKVFVAVDPQLGPLAIGYHERLPSVVAWDMRNGRPLWDALTDVEEIGDLEVEGISVHGRNVYIALENKLWCLDLATGRQKWAHRFAQNPDPGDGQLAIGDPYPPGVRGAIVVPAGEGQWLYALDRESGAELWERQYEDGVKVETAEGLGVCVVRSNFSQVEIIDPAVQQPVWTLKKDVATAKPIGGAVATIVDDGILVFDARTGRTILFDPVEQIDPDRAPCGIGGHVFAIRDEDRGLYAGPDGRHLPSPVSGTLVGHILAANHTLGVLCYVGETEEGTGDDDGMRRFIGLDPATLALRFDAGPIGVAHDTDFDKHVVTDNASFVALVWRSDDSDDCELRSHDAATGRPLWTHKAPRYREHYFRGGLLVVHRKGFVEVLFPATGQLVASVREDD